MHRTAVGAALALLLPLIGSAAVPPISSLELVANGNDLVLSWPAVASPVDGYRVYEFSDESCSAGTIVCDSLATSCTLVGALVGPGPLLWRVSAYLGVEESPLSGPAYLYYPALHFAQTTSNRNIVALPAHTEWGDSHLMCSSLNTHSVPRGMITQIVSFLPQMGLTKAEVCTATLRAFTIVGGRAYAVKPSDAGVRVPIWGSGFPEVAVDLSIPRGVMDIGLYWVSLPYDHGYADLAALAADIPEALSVEVFEPAADLRRGFARATPADGWDGENVDLLGRRGLGVMVTVASPVSWLPRRICGAPGQLAPPRVTALWATRSGADVALTWKPDALAAGGYEIVRMDSKGRIPATLAEPAHLAEPAAIPAFPVLDPGAVTDPARLLFFQVVGKSGDGLRGGI